MSDDFPLPTEPPAVCNAEGEAIHQTVDTPPPAGNGEGLDPQALSIISAATVAAAKKPVGQLSRATVKDLKFIDSLQHKFGKSLGFLPTAALVANLEQNNVDLCMENDEPAGYLLCRPRLAWQPLLASIVQAAVCMDAQRRHHGLALLLQVEARARDAGQVAIQANCAVGVEANEFWAAAGFKPIAHLTPATKSGREIICWRKPLQRSLPAWFTLLPAKAGGRSLGVQSKRNINRASKDLDFASKFVAGKILVAGDPNHISNGYYKSVEELRKAGD
jgi:N-acetylglutamate synthase-like GNAT family acetyltransferase